MFKLETFLLGSENRDDMHQNKLTLIKYVIISSNEVQYTHYRNPFDSFSCLEEQDTSYVHILSLWTTEVLILLIIVFSHTLRNVS